MGSIKNFSYPDVKIDEAIRCVRKFKEELKGEATTLDALAGVWGHKSGKSGSFLVKLSDLRKYGLITPKGRLRLTERGDRIATPLNNREFDENLRKMIFSIDLWRKLYERLGGKLPSDNFWIILHEVTGSDRDVAKKNAEKIRKVYIDAITKIKTGEIGMTPATPEFQPSVTPSSQLIELRAGDIYMKLPKTDSNIDLVKKALESLKTISQKKEKPGTKASEEGK